MLKDELAGYRFVGDVIAPITSEQELNAVEEALAFSDRYKAVRDHIAQLGGVARTERDSTEIVHTTDYRSMLTEAMKTETHAAASYKRFLALPGVDAELHDAIEQIYFEEERSVEELKQLMDS